MSYGLKYKIPFLNRQQDSCEIRISEKDYVGGSTQFEGSPKPLVLSSRAQDNQIPYGICSTEAVLEFYTAGLVTLEDFYNEDDTHWLVEFYYRGLIMWTGYLQLDNSSERITDQNHILSLNANDGTGRLQNLYFVSDSTGLPLQVNWTLAETLSQIFSFVPQLHIYAWLNIFENSTDDRDVHDYLTFLPQTAFNTRYFTNSDGTAQSYYDILNNILIDFRSCMRQANGVWQIIRWGDVRIFADASMPGTEYVGFTGGASEIFFNSSIDVGRGLGRYPINENQINRILRPYQFSKETFNYQQPPLIIQFDLQLPLGATPFATNTIGSLRYDDYDLDTYFPNWTRLGGDTSYLEVVTDITAAPDTEVNRYIITPAFTAQSGITFNPIPVSKGDLVSFSLNFRTDTDIGGDLRFYVRLALITAADDLYTVVASVGTLANPSWNLTDFIMYLAPDTSGDTTQWMPFSIDMNNTQSPLGTILIPEDGILSITVYGTDGDAAHDDYMTFWKDINLTIANFLNDSIQITGQFHNNSQAESIRNNLQYDTVLDDSQRNTISGTLFTNAITTFGHSIGDIYFTKTAAWHRQGVTEARRLGDLNTFNDLFIQRKTRTIVEGDFYGVRDINLMSLINLTWLPGKKFIFGTGTFDYMECIWNGNLYELFDEGEVDGDLDNTYLFNYVYNNG